VLDAQARFDDYFLKLTTKSALSTIHYSLSTIPTSPHP
jgi:hypothetical protein